MGISLPQDRKKKVLIGAIAAGIVASVLTMFIPTSVLETITGTTGLSELVPATAAPLGDKARALIAFGAGALTLALAALILLRKDESSDGYSSHVEEPEDAPDAATLISGKAGFGDRLAKLKDRLPDISLPKMPWVRGENEIRDLSDLPSVRSVDAHPDAPARKPLLATQELPSDESTQDQSAADPVTSETNIEITASPPADEVIPVLKVEPAVETAAEVQMEEQPIAEHSNDVVSDASEPSEAEIISVQSKQQEQRSLPDMVARLEASLNRRSQQLAELKQTAQASHAIPANGPANDMPEPAIQNARDPLADPLAETDALPEVNCPPLEAVPDDKDESGEEIDTALNAALETLQRMNAQAR